MSSKVVFLVWLYIVITLAQQDKDYLKMIRREPIKGMNKWIMCDTCKIAMKQANRRARGMRDAMKNKQFEEEHFRNITKYMCQPYHDHGEWITTYDVVKKKNNLVLQHHDVFGKCSHECETIAVCCQSIIDEFEEEIPEYLYSKISTAKLQKKVCKNACKKKTNKPKMQSSWGSEAFQEIADDQKGMFRSFVMGELYKREKPKDEDTKQQDYLQRYAEAYIDQTETIKKQKEEKRRYQNKLRAKKGLPPLPEEDEEEEEEDKEDKDEANENNDEAENENESEAASKINSDKIDLSFVT